MRSGSVPADTIAAIVLGILQLGIGLVSLWQQRQLRRAYRTRAQGLEKQTSAYSKQRREEREEDVRSERLEMAYSKVMLSTWSKMRHPEGVYANRM
jgi:uncharacterized protein HemX